MRTTLSTLREINSQKPDLTIHQMLILLMVREKPTITFREMALAIGVSTSAITGAMDRLIKFNMVTRVPRGTIANTDGRTSGAVLQPAAEEYIAKLDEILATPVPVS